MANGREMGWMWGALVMGAGMLAGAGTAPAQCVNWSSLPWPAGADFTAAASPRACVEIAPEACVVLGQPIPGDYFLDSLLVEGTLRFEPTANVLLNARKVIVDGVLEGGTEAAPFAAGAALDLDLTDGPNCQTSYLVAPDPLTGALTVTAQAPNLALLHPAGEENRTLLVRGEATLDLHGATRPSTWKLLKRRADPGANSVRVFRGEDWQPGDEIVVASTDYDMFQAEVRAVGQIQPVLGSALDDLVLDAPLGHLHWAGRVGSATEPKVYEDAEVGLLSHNVKVYSSDRAPVAGQTCADLAYLGAEIRILRQNGSSPTVRLQHVEIYNAGKFDELGHYPVHFHMLGPVPGSYVKGISVHDSSNKAIVLHGTQQLLVEDNVAYNVIGHAYYLEPMGCDAGDLNCFDTAYNTLRHNLGAQVRGCGTLDLEEDGFDSSVFHFEDPRNVLVDNAAAGAIHSGFYYGNDRRMGLDRWRLCAEEAIDYAATDFTLLDESSFSYANAPYGPAEYAAKGYRDLDGTVHCHGAFAGNSAHSSLFGFWAEEHKDSLIRLGDFTTYKNSDRAVLLKNHGVSELVRLRAADNATAVWPASHAYHMGYSPQFLLIDSHLVGESGNLGEIGSADEILARRSLPAGRANAAGDGGVPFYGVQVYEGHFHATQTLFEKFAPLAALPNRPVAAFGRHQHFPFYTNNPDNSARAVSFDAASNHVWFDFPDANASGEATVILRDLDGSVSGTAGAWIIPRDGFIVPGPSGAPAPTASLDAAWNAYVVTPAEKYGQLIVEWCDTGANQFCQTFGGPSSSWRSQNTGVGVYGVIKGLEIRDLTDCAGLGAGCLDVLEAEHSADGTHDKLGGNLLSGHDYRVSFWQDENGTPLPTSSLSSLDGIQVHLRYAPVGTSVRVTVPSDRAPSSVVLYRGETAPVATDITANNPGAPPASPTQWYYDAALRRVYLYLDAAADYENASVLLLLP